MFGIMRAKLNVCHYIMRDKELVLTDNLKGDINDINSEILGDVVIYQSDDGLTHIDVKMIDDTVWLTQQQLVDLYHTSKANISEHIKHLFEEGELDEKAVVRKFRTTATDGKNYNVTYSGRERVSGKYKGCCKHSEKEDKKWITS